LQKIPGYLRVAHLGKFLALRFLVQYRMAVIYDGKRQAELLEGIVKNNVLRLRDDRDVVPRLVTILVGDNPAGRVYVNLKKAAAERVGCKLDIVYFEKISVPELASKIKVLCDNKDIHGVMVQLPLPGKMDSLRSRVIDAILPSKDVDGLREDSPFYHPTALAIYDIVSIPMMRGDEKIVLVGDKGMVGRGVKRLFGDRGIEYVGIDKGDDFSILKEADIVVNVTGKEGLVTADAIKEGAAVVDIGSFGGSIDFEEISKKAKFVTPTVGGVGPVTIAYLLENLYRAAFLL